jgi:putative membrane protein
MNRWTQIALAAGLALSVSACAGDRAPDADRNAAREGAAGTTGTSGASSADAGFVQEQLKMGQAEVDLGKLAQDRGTHPDVKKYGEMMVIDHRMAGEELKAVAGHPTEPSKDAHDAHGDLREELSKLSGPEFDRRYMEEMIEDHEKGIAELEKKSEHADDPQVREWAAKTLPKMRQHLAKAKAVQETLKAEGDRKN